MRTIEGLDFIESLGRQNTVEYLIAGGDSLSILWLAES